MPLPTQPTRQELLFETKSQVFKEMYTIPTSKLMLTNSELPTLHFAYASSLEGVGWLTLGLSVAYFAEDALREGVERLTRQLNFGEYLEERGYLFDPYWLDVFNGI